MIVYMITNVENGKRYVGMTESPLSRRWTEHKTAARHGSTKTALYNAMRLYGVESFVCEQVASILPGLSRETLCEIERVIIAQEGTLAPSGYNMTEGGDGLPAGATNPNLGRKSSKEHKAKVAATWTPEKRAKFAEMRRERNKTMVLSEDHGQRISRGWTLEKRKAQSDRMKIRRRALEQKPELRAMYLDNLARGRAKQRSILTGER